MFKETDKVDRVQFSSPDHVMLTAEAYEKLHADLEAYAQNGKPLGGFYEGIYELNMKADAFISFSTGAILLLEKRFKYAETPD